MSEIIIAQNLTLSYERDEAIIREASFKIKKGALSCIYHWT